MPYSLSKSKFANFLNQKRNIHLSLYGHVTQRESTKIQSVNNENATVANSVILRAIV